MDKKLLIPGAIALVVGIIIALVGQASHLPLLIPAGILIGGLGFSGIAAAMEGSQKTGSD